MSERKKNKNEKKQSYLILLGIPAILVNLKEKVLYSEREKSFGVIGFSINLSMKHAELKTMKSKTFLNMYIMYINISLIHNK